MKGMKITGSGSDSSSGLVENSNFFSSFFSIEKINQKIIYLKK